MALTKRIIAPYDGTGLTLYAIIERDADGYLLDDADGSFAAAPADPYVALTEHATVKRTYRKDESRLPWLDGAYNVWVYEQAGGSPSPVADSLVVSLRLYVRNDQVVSEAEYIAAVWQLAQAYLDAPVSETSTAAALADVRDYLLGAHTLNISGDTLTVARPDGSVLVVFDLAENTSGTPVKSYLARTPQ